MAIQLAESVGKWGKNKPVDVMTVQVHLNRVPSEWGGPKPSLDPDSKVGPLTIGAIARFQKHHFGWSDGRIDPGQKTHRKLEEVVANQPPVFDVHVNGDPLASPLGWPDPALQASMLERILDHLSRTEIPTLDVASWLKGLSPARLTAIDVALQEAIPYPGRVSDLMTSRQVDPVDGKTKRCRIGWPRLKEYFDEAMQGFLAARWHKDEVREGILCWNKRVIESGGQPGGKMPQEAGTTEGIQWCGIFTTWVYRRSQARWPNFRHRPLRWMSPMMSMPLQVAMELKFGDKLDLRPGDVGVIQHRTHHFVIISPILGGAKPKDQFVWIVSANDEYQSVLVKTMKVDKILSRYSADDIFI
ncbi:MAG TPA: hypothetical protein PKD86_03280 [Gemmatales bacterium]|nr:hypothetical protein [Gemmatales bacterium]